MVGLLDLFEGRRQLIVYRHFFEPGVCGWPERGCRGCSMMAAQDAHPAHLNARDTTLAYVSRAPQPDIGRWKRRTGFDVPWYTLTDDFDADFGVGEWHGTNAFLRDGDRVFRTYFINGRGDEALGSTFSYLDMTALGRQEDWEDSPEGYPQSDTREEWWRLRDEYDLAGDRRLTSARNISAAFTRLLTSSASASPSFKKIALMCFSTARLVRNSDSAIARVALALGDLARAPRARGRSAR